MMASSYAVPFIQQRPNNLAMQQTTSKRLLPAQPPARQGIARNRGATGAQSCIKAAAL
jgi:hypothetical protein